VPASLPLPGADAGSADAISILHERHARSRATSQIVPTFRTRIDNGIRPSKAVSFGEIQKH